MNSITKKCSGCKLEKSISEFHKDNKRWDGISCYCKKCASLNNKRNRKSKGVQVFTKSFPLRLAVIKILGGKCNKCGFSDIRALQLDHINGGGEQERKNIGQRYIYKKAYQLAKEGKNNEYQILCANCNWIKRYENKEN